MIVKIVRLDIDTKNFANYTLKEQPLNVFNDCNAINITKFSTYKFVKRLCSSFKKRVVNSIANL